MTNKSEVVPALKERQPGREDKHSSRVPANLFKDYEKKRLNQDSTAENRTWVCRKLAKGGGPSLGDG